MNVFTFDQQDVEMEGQTTNRSIFSSSETSIDINIENNDFKFRVVKRTIEYSTTTISKVIRVQSDEYDKRIIIGMVKCIQCIRFIVWIV
jgi:hypothetical protein